MSSWKFEDMGNDCPLNTRKNAKLRQVNVFSELNFHEANGPMAASKRGKEVR